MQIIISPAKRMKPNDLYDVWYTTPHFMKDANIIREYLKSLDDDSLHKIWNCNDTLFSQNKGSLHELSLDKSLTPAIICYDGLQFKNIKPTIFTVGEWGYVNEHLFIISAMYGALRPSDGIIQYRLEMQAPCKVNNSKDLYDYWGRRLFDFVTKEDKVILNLASKEYSKCFEPFVDENVTFITCSFMSLKNGKLAQKSTEAKMARGAMVRYCATNEIDNIEDIKKFNEFGFEYNETYSTTTEYVFIKK